MLSAVEEWLLAEGEGEDGTVGERVNLAEGSDREAARLRCGLGDLKAL